MTRRFRVFLFLAFFLIFCLLAAAIVLYSNGWRVSLINCDNLKICRLNFRKTGGIYIETRPQNVQIYLDGKNIPDQSGFLKSGTLISDLLPRIYKIKISKDGYFGYSKNIKVDSALVAEMINTVLIPQKIADQKILLGEINTREIFDVDGSGRLLLKTPNSLILYDPSNVSSTPINLGIIKKARFYPSRSDQFIVEKRNGIYDVDINQSTSTKIIDFSLQNNSFNHIWEIYGSKIYFLHKSDLNNNLEVYNLMTDSTSTLATTTLAGDFKISGDGEKIAFINEGEIKIYFLDNWYQNFKVKKGDILSFDLGSDIKKVFWYKDSLHLIVLFKNGDVKFVEVDNRLPQNIFSLSIGIDDIFYFGGKIYFIQGGEIFYFSAFE